MTSTAQNLHKIKPNKLQKLKQVCYFNLEKCLMTITLVFFCIIFIPILIVDIFRMENTNATENSSCKINTTTSSPTTDTETPMTSYVAVPFKKKLLGPANQNCAYEGNTIVCNGLSAGDVVKQVNQLAPGVSTVIELQLKNLLETSISNSSLNKLNPQIKTLTISGNTLTSLKSHAFSAHPFAKNLCLTISDSGISLLRKESFMQTKLQSFQFRSQNSKTLKIEGNVFGSAGNDLQVLQLNGFILEAQSLKNLTGCEEKLTGLLTLDLNYNTIPTIVKNSFVALPNVQQIFLKGNSIESIEQGAFNGIFSLTLIYLSNNLLKTLPGQLFSGLTSLKVHVWTDSNPWICDCKLEWLKVYLLARNNTNILMCNSKDGTYTSNYVVEFCPNGSTPNQDDPSTLRKSTTVPYDSTTAVPIGNFTNLSCTDVSKSSKNISSFSKLFLQDTSLKIKDCYINLIFYQNGNRPSYTFVIYSSGTCNESNSLIWTNVNDKSDYGCAYKFGKTSGVYVELEYASVYTVCLATTDPKKPKLIVRRDCTAIKTSTEFGKQTWIANKDKLAVIFLVCICLVVAILVSILLVYLIVRQNPELIKGNKRILLVKQKRKSPSFLVMPNYETISNESDGYLTPRSLRYSRVKTKKLYDISEANKVLDSVYSSDKVDHYKETIYEPPPLPPNHPCGRKPSIQPYFHSNM